jgi:hypothetical protein
MAGLALHQSVALLQVDGDRQSGRRARVLALVLIHLLGLLTHPVYLFVAAAAALAGLSAPDPARRPLVWSPALAVGAYLAVWGRVLAETVRSEATSWMAPPAGGDLMAGYLLTWGTGRGAMLVGVALAVTLADRARTRRFVTAPDVRWVVAASAGAWLLPFAASFAVPVYLPARTPILMLPATAVALAACIARLGSPLLVTIVSIVMGAGAVGAAWAGARDGDPVPTRDSVAAIAARSTCGDVIVAPGLSHAAVEYYLRRFGKSGCLAVERFPGELLNLTGRLRDVEAHRGLQAEARQTADSLAGRAGTIWVLLANRGVDAEASGLIEPEVRRALACSDPLPLRGAFFDRVLPCRPR